MPNSLKSRLKGLVWKGLLSKKDLSRIYTDNDVIEELEKIRAELIGKCNHCNCVSCVFVSLKDEKCFMKVIINEHISELKGENK